MPQEIVTTFERSILPCLVSEVLRPSEFEVQRFGSRVVGLFVADSDQDLYVTWPARLGTQHELWRSMISIAQELTRKEVPLSNVRLWGRRPSRLVGLNER